MTYRVSIRGRAVPQGSKRAFVNPKTGRAILTEQHGARHKDWRQLVTMTASQPGTAPAAPIDGPVELTILCTFARPKAHYGSGRNADRLREGAPAYVSTRSVGDADKLARSILDALDAAGWFGDDAQVARLTITRQWANDGVDAVEVAMRSLDTRAVAA